MRVRIATAISLAALAACALLVGFSGANFTATAQNPQTLSAVTDFLAPTAGASVIAKSQGGVTGFIKAGGTFFVYANVTDSGNPASGIASVKADVSAITSVKAAEVLSAGSFAVGGVSYNYRSAQLTASGTLKAGPQPYTLTLVDAAGNSAAQSFSVTVDNGPFEGSAFATGNVAGGTEGKPEKGDTVIYTFNKAPEPESIVSGWNGSGTKAVTVSIDEKGTLTVAGATIGSVTLQGKLTEGKTTTFSGSTMSLSGSAVTVVLGTLTAGTAKTETGKSKAGWTPSASVFDRAWNACSGTEVNEGNAKQF
jgi:hypothetical protein